MNRRYTKIASAAYDRHADRGQRFNLFDVIADIEEELTGETVTAELIREFATQLAHAVDGRRAQRSESQQLDLLTGDTSGLDTIWRLGEGVRVRARYANRTDVVAWIGMKADNAKRVTLAYEKDRDTIAQLLPFMTDDAVLLGQATDAWMLANPPLS